MKILPFTPELGARHSGNRGWLGVNPRIETVGMGEKFDYVWHSAWGDGNDIFEDMEKARRIGPCIFNVTGDSCYVPENQDGNIYFVTNMNHGPCWQIQVPYSYHASVEWHKQHGIYPYEKKYLANFLGSFDTNPKRRRLMELNSDTIIIRECDGWRAAQDGRWNVIREHDDLLAESWFTLCPNGIGKSSIRVVEAIFRNSIPVLMDDESCLFSDPMEWAIRYPLGGNMGELKELLESLEGTKEYYERRDAMRAFKNHFLLRDERHGCSSTIGYTEIIRDLIWP